MDTIGPLADTVEQARCHCGHGIDEHRHIVLNNVGMWLPNDCVRPACGCNTYGPPR